MVASILCLHYGCDSKIISISEQVQLVFDLSMGIPTSAMIFIYVCFALNVFIGFRLGCPQANPRNDKAHHSLNTLRLHTLGAICCTKIVTMTFYCLYGFIITHTTLPQKSTNIKFLKPSLEIERKAYKSHKNTCITLSLRITYGAAFVSLRTCRTGHTLSSFKVWFPVKGKVKVEVKFGSPAS